MAEIPHTPAYTENCKPCLLRGVFGACSSSGTDHNISRKELSLLWMPGGHVALVTAVSDGDIVECGAIPTPVPVGKLRLYWIIRISLEPRFSHTCDDAQEPNSLLYRTGPNILSLLCTTSNPPSHTGTVQDSGRTPLDFGGSGQR